MEPRPKAIAVVAMFLFVATVMALVVGTSLLFHNRLLDHLWEPETDCGRAQRDTESQSRSFLPHSPFMPFRITPFDFNRAHKLDYRPVDLHRSRGPELD